MVEEQLRERHITDELVLAAMAKVPRHEFVSEGYRDQAYEDKPLPIGYGQTISQPYMVALMLALLHPGPRDSVLEIGTGSGYQTALLAELAGSVDSIERQSGLAAVADAILRALGYSDITLHVGDGSVGLPERAPFDAIVVSAGAPQFPDRLFTQLKEGGRLVVPVGAPESQQLLVVRREQGRPSVSESVPCRFVPLIGEDGYRE
ncbi:MAG: protein-L-isoaspartate(D-aspartate) O-methyltransferase [Acidobacteriaceae bacterium]|nr:protein-L-isoaspartate(D-aspartate) O-methyltransferase [Acidobacteriaceae bacterium]